MEVKNVFKTKTAGTNLAVASMDLCNLWMLMEGHFDKKTFMLVFFALKIVQLGFTTYVRILTNQPARLGKSIIK